MQPSMKQAYVWNRTTNSLFCLRGDIITESNVHFLSTQSRQNRIIYSQGEKETFSGNSVILYTRQQVFYNLIRVRSIARGKMGEYFPMISSEIWASLISLLLLETVSQNLASLFLKTTEPPYMDILQCSWLVCLGKFGWEMWVHLSRTYYNAKHKELKSYN